MTGAASRRKGASYERDVVAWLRAEGRPHVERRGPGMAADWGDVTGWPGVVVECKNRQRIDLAGFVDQMTDAVASSGADLGVVIVKRAGVRDVAEHYAVMPAGMWLALMTEAGR